MYRKHKFHQAHCIAISGFCLSRKPELRHQTFFFSARYRNNSLVVGYSLAFSAFHGTSVEKIHLLPLHEGFFLVTALYWFSGNFSIHNTLDVF